MTVDLHQLVFLGLLTSSIHWIGARSEIARPLWSRYPRWLQKLSRCAACSGWWLGLLASMVGVHAVAAHYRVVEIVAGGLAGVFVTPIFEGAMMWGLRESAIEEEHPEQPHGDLPNPDLTDSGETTPRPPRV